MRKLKLVPLGSESVEEKVAAFRQYNDEVGFDFETKLLKKPITDYYCGYFDWISKRENSTYTKILVIKL